VQRYRIEFLPAAKRDLSNLTKPQQVALATIIRGLANDPRPSGCKAVAGYRGHYRLRDGDYRIVYELKARLLLVLVVAVGHRSGIYKRMRRRLR
jgi:mRNA interferase RelE/StbE